MGTNWENIGDFGPKDGTLSAQWMLVVEEFSGRTSLKITADGSWNIIPGLNIAVGPDGQPLLKLADSELYMPGVPAGALLGKLGGSSADTSGNLYVSPAPRSAASPPSPSPAPASTGQTPAEKPAAPVTEVAGGSSAVPASDGPASGGGVFVIGAHCILPVGTALQGPLYIGFNIRSRPVPYKKLKVSVSGAPES
jgi:hypothetical protein